MEYEDARHPGLIGYDERTETWYVRSAESQRLMLTRRSLTHLVDMYNSVYSGRPMALIEVRELRRLREESQSASPSPCPPSRDRAPATLLRVLRRMWTGRRLR